VSSHQGVFSLDQEGPSFTDVGSRNGTRINGKRLTPRKAGRLKPGDKIRFGETIFKVLLDGPEPDALPMEDAAGPASPPSDVAEARAPAKPFESP
ncbi:FHA domain-containing protein, partial [Streptomyces brasiliscabiei]|uniref:FHA domain-containing protein n=1 Tax=Streptomyces brasiliscabiei TaxID=2736302 RepID=UPI003015886C